jgi:hypothetical protein
MKHQAFRPESHQFFLRQPDLLGDFLNVGKTCEDIFRPMDGFEGTILKWNVRFQAGVPG